ncbi:amidase [Mycolicibacterium iranicum]|uniref:amidase n=1 Tax=Mycolicibacterium iranicum TaxID=912594 RepID=UPI0004675965|nr:amidase [Mycolicibacterium iranicum]
MDRIDAFADDALGDLDAVGLVAALSAGSVSAAEVVDAAIARTEKVNPALNGLAHEAFERARVRGGLRHPYGGFFDGVPSFIKDNVAVADMPTMRGTDAWDPVPASGDGDFAKAFLATGVVPIGKTRMSEFGFSAAAEHPRLGPVRNPWNTEHTAGASSSGSGAFVAAGVVPIAHANDGGGSIRIPASCNGLVGLKPSRGRLPLDSDMRQMPLRIVANGVVTRSVRDTAAFYREIEKVSANPKLPPIGDIAAPSPRRMRIAVCTSSIIRESSPEVRELTLRTASLLERLGHRIEVIDNPIPARFIDDFLLYWSFLAYALIKGGRRTFGPTFDRDRLDNLSLGLHDWAGRNLHRVPLAIVRLQRIRRITSRMYSTYDVLLTPTLADVPPPVGHLDPTAPYQQIIDRLVDWVAFTPLQNAAGEPAISLPLAESASGLPVGMMFAAGVGDEARLLQLAYELEEAQPWPRIQS